MATRSLELSLFSPVGLRICWVDFKTFKITIMQVNQLPSQNLIECGRKVAIAIAYREQVKSIVKEIQSQVLKDEKFTAPTGTRVLEDRFSCQLDDATYLLYLTRLRDRYHAVGLKVAVGTCPQYLADCLLSTATKKLIAASEELEGLDRTLVLSSPGIPHMLQVARLMGFLAPYIKESIIHGTEAG
jgi:hypothetical protein